MYLRSQRDSALRYFLVLAKTFRLSLGNRSMRFHKFN
jgi:hypothetical protein